MSPLARLLSAAIVLSAPACVSTPFTETEVASANTPVTFRGYALGPNQVIRLRSSADPSGPFTEFATTRSSGSGVALANGDTVYPWSIETTVSGWSGTPCAGQEVYVRVHAGSFDAFVFDDAAGLLCVTGEIAEQTPTIFAFAECASDASPNLHLTKPAADGPTIHKGDLTVVTPADAANWQCLETVYGDLVVDESDLSEISLPALETVTGDVTLVFTREDMGFWPAVRVIDLPVLASIGGSLFIESPAPIPSQNVTLDVGMDALTSLGGDLDISVESFNVDMGGLQSLATMTGSLRFDNFETGDTAMHGFLESLTTVGNVELIFGSTIFGVLEDLQTVNGNFSMLHGNVDFESNASLTALTTVSGDFTIDGVRLLGDDGDPVFPSLSTVGGTLTYRDVRQRSALSFGAPVLAVGGLSVEDNLELTEVGGDNLQLTPSGGLSFTGNTNLCSSSISAFAATLPGWTGTLVDVGNAGC